MGILLDSVNKLKTVTDDLKASLVERGADMASKKLKDYPSIIRNLPTAGKPLSAIRIKNYSGKTLDWIADGDMPHKLELESIIPEDATIEIRNINQAKVHWESSNPNVVKIIETTSVNGEISYNAVVVKSGQCTITATMMGVQDSFNVSMEYQSDFHILKSLLQSGVDTAKSRFPVGTEIADVWTDPEGGTIYQMPLIVAHYGDCELTDGTIKKGAYLVRKNILPFNMPFDVAESGSPSNPDYSRRNYGNNRYLHSNIHQWLNTKKTKGIWFQKRHQYDTVPNYAASRSGYMKGCSATLLDAISEVRVPVYTANIDSNMVDKVAGNFFLPSLENLNFVTGGSDKPSTGVEGPVWEYYKTGSPTDGSNARRAFKTPSGSSNYPWLRSAYRSTSGYVHIVDSDGSCSSSSAYGSYAVAPACFIC